MAKYNDIKFIGNEKEFDDLMMNMMDSQLERGEDKVRRMCTKDPDIDAYIKSLIGQLEHYRSLSKCTGEDIFSKFNGIVNLEDLD